MKRLAVAALILIGCSRRHEPTATPDATAPSAAPIPPATRADAGVLDAGGPPDPCVPLPAPTSATSIGHTSIVFKLVLPDGRKVAWKPATNGQRKGRYKSEIASYRLARALGLAANVPPACAQAFASKDLTVALAHDPKGMSFLVDDVVLDGPLVHGAAITWVDGLQFWALEKEPARSEVRGWLGDAPIPDDKKDLARQVSDLVVFDFLTTNWDRYSGGNVGLDKSGATVLFIDNDAAFMNSPPRASTDQARLRLGATNRFSRSLVQHLEALDATSLAAALGDDETGHPLLDEAGMRHLEIRRTEVVRAIAAKRTAHGDEATLFFP